MRSATFQCRVRVADPSSRYRNVELLLWQPVATCIAVPRVALVFAVQRVKTVIALLLLSLWLPCTMHCQAEALGWLGSDSTCCEKGHADESQKPDCSECAACSSVESGGYWLPQKAAFVHVLLAAALHLAPDTLDPIRESAALTVPAPDSVPQWLCQSWSFRCRTALAPRAPSLLA